MFVFVGVVGFCLFVFWLSVCVRGRKWECLGMFVIIFLKKNCFFFR